jgi:hypothetical protein
MASANLQIGPIFLFLSQKDILPFLLEQFSIPQAQLWQLGAGARVRRHPVVNQGALRTRDWRAFNMNPVSLPTEDWSSGARLFQRLLWGRCQSGGLSSLRREALAQQYYFQAKIDGRCPRSCARGLPPSCIECQHPIR